MIKTKLLVKVCLCFLALSTYASPITSSETEDSTTDPTLSVNENEFSIPKNRHKRAAQNILVGQRLVTFVNGVPVQVPMTRQINTNQMLTTNGVVTNLPTAFNGLYSQFPIYPNVGPLPSFKALKRAFFAQRLQAAGGQYPYASPVVVTVPVQQQTLQQQVPVNVQSTTTQNPVVNAVRLLQLANQVQQLQTTTMTTTTTTPPPPTAQPQTQPPPQQQPLPINIVIQSPGQTQQPSASVAAQSQIQPQQINQALNAVASSPVGQVQQPPNALNLSPTPSNQPQQQPITNDLASSALTQAQQLPIPINFFPSQVVQAQQQAFQSPNSLNFFTTPSIQPLQQLQQQPLPIGQNEQPPNLLNFFQPLSNQIKQQQLSFPVNVFASPALQPQQQLIQNTVTPSPTQIPITVFALPSVQPLPVQSLQQPTQNTIASTPPQTQNTDAGTTNTIQEILTNLQGQQLAQASFSIVHLYIFGYLLIGVVIGSLVYVIIQKKKKKSRQSVRITQPHRFAVPSRPQRSSYP